MTYFVQDLKGRTLFFSKRFLSKGGRAQSAAKRSKLQQFVGRFSPLLYLGLPLHLIIYWTQIHTAPVHTVALVIRRLQNTYCRRAAVRLKAVRKITTLKSIISCPPLWNVMRWKSRGSFPPRDNITSFPSYTMLDSAASAGTVSDSGRRSLENNLLHIFLSSILTLSSQLSRANFMLHVSPLFVRTLRKYGKLQSVSPAETWLYALYVVVSRLRLAKETRIGTRERTVICLRCQVDCFHSLPCFQQVLWSLTGMHKLDM